MRDGLSIPFLVGGGQGTDIRRHNANRDPLSLHCCFRRTLSGQIVLLVLLACASIMISAMQRELELTMRPNVKLRHAIA